MFIDTEEARLLEERYITTIKTTPPDFVKALSPVTEFQPGETAKYVLFLSKVIFLDNFNTEQRNLK